MVCSSYANRRPHAPSIWWLFFLPVAPAFRACCVARAVSRSLAHGRGFCACRKAVARLLLPRQMTKSIAARIKAFFFMRIKNTRASRGLCSAAKASRVSGNEPKISSRLLRCKLGRVAAWLERRHMVCGRGNIFYLLQPQQQWLFGALLHLLRAHDDLGVVVLASRRATL